MSFRTGLLATVEAVRSIAGPNGLDIRPNWLTIRTRTWSGSRVRLGTSSDSDLELPRHYPVRYVSSSEVSSSAGRYETGDIKVDHITPSDGAGVGFTRDQLNPTVTSNNVEILYVITGEHSGIYDLVDCQTFRPFSYRLVLRRKAE